MHPLPSSRTRSHAAAWGRIGIYAKADLLWIELAKPQAKLFGTLGCRLEQPVERRNRTVMQIGGRRPDAVQGARAIVRYPRDDGVGDSSFGSPPKVRSDSLPARRRLESEFLV